MEELTAPQSLEFTEELVEVSGLRIRGRLALAGRSVGAALLAVSAITGVGSTTASASEAAGCLAQDSLCSWGSNGGFELGNDEDPYTMRLSPSDIPDFKASSIADGNGVMVASGRDGTVWQWGSQNGSLTPKPRQVEGISSAQSVAAGYSSRYALLANGRVMAWGGNGAGQLGNGTTSSYNEKPGEVQSLDSVKAIASSTSTAYALRSDGTVWAWGNGREGHLGSGKPEDALNHNELGPVKVLGLSDVVSIGATANDGFAVRSDGTVWGWGNSYNKLLGDDINQNAISPVQIKGLSNIKFLGNSSLSNTEFAVDGNGQAWGWGSSRAGAMGDGKCDLGQDSSTPVPIPGMTDVTSISGSERSAFAVRSDGSLYSWGYNDAATLANGTPSEQCSTPDRVNNIGAVRQVYMGNIAAFAISGSGGVPPIPSEPKPLEYVALGDSYSSGEANSPFINTKNDKICHRSEKAWPYIVDNKIKQVKLAGELACSGAKASTAFVKSYLGQKPQLEAMKNLNPDLVTVTIGGNDIGFGPILRYCYLYQCTNKDFDKEAKVIDTFGKVASGYYNAIKTEAPKARTVVVGYPQLFPSKQSSTTRCGWLSSNERTRLNELGERLNKRLEAAAKGVGFEFVSTNNALNGHELCTKDSWAYPIGKAPATSDGHPLAKGQNAIAALVQKQLKMS